MEFRKTQFLMLSLIAACAMLPAGALAVSKYDAIVVRGDLPTDYVVASIYASTENIPLVLVNPNNIQVQIRQEFAGYEARDYNMLLIIGGESAISRGVENELDGMGFLVNRLWDWNRYGTAGRVAIDLWGESSQVVVTNGEDYGGFLLAQRIALERGVPILFMMNSTVPEETIDALTKLGTQSVILVGGGADASNALSRLGLSVETIETVAVGGAGPGSGEQPDQNFLLLITAAVAIIAVVITALIFRLKKLGKATMFIMTEDEERLVEILKTHGKTEQNRLAELTGYSKPRVSRMLISLVDRGIIERERYKKTYKVRLSSKIT